MKIKTLFLSLAAFISALTIVSCTKESPKKDTLTVEPSSAIAFKAANNMDVKLKITTSAKDWSFKAPEWITVKKDANSLFVNVKENTSKDANVGRITISAGSAEPVKISVTQEGKISGSHNEEAVSVKLNNKGAGLNIFATKGKDASVSFTAVIAEAATKDIEVELFFDAEYLSEYNYINKQEFSIFPAGKIKLPENTKITIAAGKTESDPVELTLNGDDLDFNTQYLVPLYIKPVKYAKINQDARLNYVFMRKVDRTVKNVVYFEVNDCNPLNALEYVLEDGTPFFDAVILFAANINYDATDDIVFLHNNPNVQALLNESEVYLQPLRKAGIKVYLGLLGNHDPAGLAQLSDWGAHEWAQEVADACKKYKLDGVNLDDEYSSYPTIGNKWFAYPSKSAAARLMYELKVAMKEKCSWPTEVSHFDWGHISDVPSVNIEGVEHKPVEFVDFHVANYGTQSYPYGGMTKAQCSGASIELNRGYTPWEESWAEDIKKEGYGWCMWFAFDPSGTGTVSSNYYRAFPLFRKAAQAFYGQDVKEPTGVYKKIGEGKYDPKRYDR
jgi:Glycosyl hydrolases family 18./Domain of unknown function (DUF1735).